MACFLLDPVELVDEVHVPRRPTELPVGRRTQTHFFLHAHDLANRLVLDGAQPRVVDAAGSVILARLQQRRRAKQAADVVGAERRHVAERHGAIIAR